MNLPLLLGAALLAGLLLLPRKRRAQRRTGKTLTPTEQKIASVTPSVILSPEHSNKPVVKFSRRRVFWRLHPKTGAEQKRFQVIETPETLAERASQKIGRRISPDVLGLAALMASEAGRGHDIAKVAIAHAALTYTKEPLVKRHRGLSLLEILTEGDGRFGSQHGRYAATRRPPTLKDIELAEAVLNGRLANPTPGAVQWDSPKTQDELAARGEPGYEGRGADLIARKRKADGMEEVSVPGVDTRYLRMWRRA